MRTLDPALIRHQIDNLSVAYPELANDEDDWSLALASETDLDDLLVMLVRRVDDTKALLEGTDARMEELATRQARFKRRIEAYRSLILKLMEAAEIQKRELAEATLSVRKGQPKVIITDEAALPDLACKFIRKPDLTKIKELLNDATAHCAGAVLSNSETSLAIRVK